MATQLNATYSPGLEGVIAGESAICQVDPAAGLLYRGYDIHELAQRFGFEEIAFLLLHGELPDATQSLLFRKELASQSVLPAPLLGLLRLMPPGAAPIDTLRTAVSMLASFDPELNDNSHDANLNKSISLIAKISTLVTSGWRISKGKEPIEPRLEMNHATRFLFCLTGQEVENWQARAMNIVMALYAEHEFNASTFSARVTASTLADIYTAVTSALGTLKGPLHGGANEQAITMLREIGTPEAVESWVKEKLGRKEKIMGFGHRVYRKGDSRVPAMRKLARELAKRSAAPPYKQYWIDVCEKLEDVMQKEKGLCANLDLYAAPVLVMMQIPPELNTPIFACSRVAGWCAHVIEQHDHNRLIRPRCLYTGPALRHP